MIAGKTTRLLGRVTDRLDIVESMRGEEIGTSEAMVFYLASRAGSTEAGLRGRLSLSCEQDSMDCARWLRSVALAKLVGALARGGEE
jgi:hypothetical protein